jgi:transcriptional regulator with XRE-family HTH domain
LHTTLRQRIAAVRSHFWLDEKKFALRLGVSASHLREVESEDCGVSVEILVGIAERFPQIDLEWLLTGESASGVRSRGRSGLRSHEVYLRAVGAVAGR